MIHALLNVGGKTEEEIDEAIKRYGSSHRYYITETKLLIESKDPQAVNRFKKINDLADFRIKSDYKNIEITQDMCHKTAGISQTVYSVIKSVLAL